MSKVQQYHVLARDGRQYGPLAPEVVEDCLLDNRLTLESLAWAAGETEWRPLIQLVKQQQPRDVLSSSEQAFMVGFARLLARNSYEVGVPSDGVDSRNNALGLKAGAALAKLAVGFLTKQRIPASVKVKGAVASQAKVHDTAAGVIALTDMFAFRNDFRHGTGAMLVVLGDSLSTLELLSRLELLRQQCKRLRDFSIEVNGARNIIMQSVIVYNEPTAFEAHRRVVPFVGYERQLDNVGWTTSLVSLVDLNRQIVDYPLMKGFLAGLQKVTGLKPFGPQDLSAALALALSE